MKVSVKSKSPVLVISLEGELVLNNREQVQKETDPLLRENKNIVFDCSKLTYIDSSGLGFFLEANSRLRASNIKPLVLANVRSIVRKSLETTRLVQVIPIYHSLEEAIASFNPSWTWRILSDVIYVKAVSNKIIELLSDLNLESDFLSEIRLCLEEAVINAMKHGNKFEKEKFVNLSYKLEGRSLTFSISDEGEGFNTTLKGKGLSLISNFMDKVSFNENGNSIRMIKNI